MNPRLCMPPQPNDAASYLLEPAVERTAKAAARHPPTLRDDLLLSRFPLFGAVNLRANR
jgi:hypothetical protein